MKMSKRAFLFISDFMIEWDPYPGCVSTGLLVPENVCKQSEVIALLNPD